VEEEDRGKIKDRNRRYRCRWRIRINVGDEDDCFHKDIYISFTLI
jgi:hypothetical protein